MQTLTQVLPDLKNCKEELFPRYFIKRMGIFGSYARGEASDNSDIDVLVELSQPIGLDFITLADELEAKLNIKVDLLTFNSLKPSLRKIIEEDLIYV